MFVSSRITPQVFGVLFAQAQVRCRVVGYTVHFRMLAPAVRRMRPCFLGGDVVRDWVEPVLGGYHLVTFFLKRGNQPAKARAVSPESVAEDDSWFGLTGFRRHYLFSLRLILVPHIGIHVPNRAMDLLLKLGRFVERAVLAMLMVVLLLDPAPATSTP